MRNNVGRNDACPCGSGKKYKKCCLDNNMIPVDFAWRKLREMEGSIIDGHLIPYMINKIPKEALQPVLDELINIDMPEEVEQELLYKNLIFPWLLFNWHPRSIGLKDFSTNDTIALQYCKDHEQKLSSEQKKFIKTISNTHFSFYVTLEVIPNQALVVKDILLGDEYRVKERQGTQYIKRGDIVFGRILTLDGQSIFVGMGPCIVHARYHLELIDFRDNLIKGNKKKLLTSEILRGKFECDLFGYFFSILEKSYNRVMPEIRNTDGDLLQMCKSFFKLKLPPKEALEKLLPLTLSKDITEFLSDDEISIPWIKKGNKRLPEWDNTLLGNIKIQEQRIILETNSEKRAKKGQTLLEKYLGNAICFQKTLIESLGPLLENMSVNPKNKKAMEDFNNSPEVQSQLKAMMEKHWERWFDEPIPMLDNKTPRQAAKTKKGKEQLEALLLLYERNDSESRDNSLRPNIPYLRAELCLNTP